MIYERSRCRIIPASVQRFGTSRPKTTDRICDLASENGNVIVLKLDQTQLSKGIGMYMMLLIFVFYATHGSKEPRC